MYFEYIFERGTDATEKFVKFGVPAMVGAAVLTREGLAFNKLTQPCNGDDCGAGPPPALSPSIITSHNQQIAPAISAGLVGRIPASVSIAAAIAHLYNWNYYVANKADAGFQNSINTATSGSPSNGTITALTTSFQKMGLAVNSSWTASIITVAPGAFSDALAYAKQAGLNSAMNQAYSMVVTSQSVSGGGSGNSGGSSSTTCDQYAAYDRITNTLGILASIWALSSLVTGPVGGAAAAGFGLTAGVLRFEARDPVVVHHLGKERYLWCPYRVASLSDMREQGSRQPLRAGL